MDAQLELSLEPQPERPASEVRTPLPALVISDETTPGELVQWWDELVAIFTAEMESAKAKAEPLDAELAKLKGQRSKDARYRAATLREHRELIFARAEDTEFRAYALFERALNDFTPRLKALLQAEELAIEGDDDPEIVNFWDCLQWPALEHCADVPLREIVREIGREAGAAAE